MSRLGSWLRGPSKTASTTSLKALTPDGEAQELASAMAATLMIINDDLDGAERELAKGDSSFHLLGSGVTAFMRALLGFEADAMKEAAERLYNSENKAYTDQKRVEKDKTRISPIYPPGAEFMLIQAMSMLMAALVGVLNESLAESLKGFYKMRKAYLMLDGLVAKEDEYIKSRSRSVAGHSSSTSLQSTQSDMHVPGGFDNTEFASIPSSKLEKLQFSSTTNETVPVEDGTVSNAQLDAKETSGTQASAKQPGTSGSSRNGQTTSIPPDDIGLDPTTGETIFTRPIDIFTHSGVSLGYGLLLLVISLIPPAFKPLLSIIGFKGDRKRGLTLLWAATKHENINGAVAALVLLGVYNGLTGFCDILPDSDKYPDDILGYPRARCESLLRVMRKRFPESKLWLLEEARMASSRRRLDVSLNILRDNTESKMRQIKALALFEKGLTCMFAHEYLECARSFEACMDLNTWSHCLYTYIIAGCHIELYRINRISNPNEASTWKTSAAKFLREAPGHSGKKKFMAKQLPFDVFVTRKIQKWEERAKAWQCDIVDAAGVSPLGELTYLWAGHKKMSPQQLELSLTRLEWEESTYPEKHETNLDESGLRALLVSSIYRNQRKLAEAREVLQSEILCHDKSLFKGHLKDDWAAPSAHYEMAVIAWFEKDVDGTSESAKIAECESWLSNVSRWDAYTLDARIGLKVTTANETLERHKAGNEIDA